MYDRFNCFSCTLTNICSDEKVYVMDEEVVVTDTFKGPLRQEKSFFE